MAKITTIDRTTCRLLAERIEAALKPIADELGVVITAKGGSFTSSQYTCKVEVATVGDDGAVKTRAADAFKQLASLYGMAPDDLGKTFRVNRKTYTIVGLATRRRARPVIAKDADGREYVFAVNDAKRFLALSAMTGGA